MTRRPCAAELRIDAAIADEAAHPVEMLLGEPEVAAGGMDVGATPRLVYFGESAIRMVADLFVHSGKMIPPP